MASSFPCPPSRENGFERTIRTTNGDPPKPSSSGSGDNTLKTKGIFHARKPVEKLDFHRDKTSEEESESSEQVFLSRSLGRLSFSLQSVNEKELVGIHPSFGKFSIPLDMVKRMNCNQNLKKIRSYLDQLAQARKALEERQPNSALTILNQANPAFRYWGRLFLLAENMQSVDNQASLLTRKRIDERTFAGDSKTILTRKTERIMERTREIGRG